MEPRSLAMDEKQSSNVTMNNSDLVQFMTEMKKKMEEMSASVSELKNRGEKRKRDEESNPGPSKIWDVNDVSSDDEDHNDFDELVKDDEDGDLDNDVILNDLAECFGSDEKCCDPIHEKLAKVANDGVRASVSVEKIKRSVIDIHDQTM